MRAETLQGENFQCLGIGVTVLISSSTRHDAHTFQERTEFSITLSLS